jgi:hypothetical protein
MDRRRPAGNVRPSHVVTSDSAVAKLTSGAGYYVLDATARIIPFAELEVVLVAVEDRLDSVGLEQIKKMPQRLK